MAKNFVDLSTVLAFINRTTEHGVPTRVAITRAARRYAIDRELVRAACRETR